MTWIAIVSLLVLLLSIAGGVASYHRAFWYQARGRHVVTIRDGSLEVDSFWARAWIALHKRVKPESVRNLIWRPSDPPQKPIQFHPYTITVNLWLLACMAGLPILLWNQSWRRRSIYRHWKDFGLCSFCGYDLRASKEICPECGNVVPVVRSF